MTAVDTFSVTLDAIKSRAATVAIMGLGYVGLPLAQLFTKAGFTVLGFDVDGKKVEQLNAGKSYIRHIPGETIAEMIGSGRFRATCNPVALAAADALLICVPTPLNQHHEPDMSYVESTAETIREQLRPGQLVILESTTYPGTLRDVVLPILATKGLKEGEDYFLAYSPEREDPGNPKFSAANIPKVVGGLDPKSHQLAVELYGSFVPQVVPVSSPEVAEACKILENTYRCVNIALVNELKILFEKMGIDVWEVIRAASTKPFGFQAFYPGPGLGGHCIPIDPFYLSWVARKYNFHTKFIELAGEINTSMPHYVIQRTLLALNSQGKAAKGSKIGILGMAYKKDVDDPRESPSFELMEELIELGAEVSFNDPYIPRIPPMRKYKRAMESTPLTAEYLSLLDGVLIATDHTAYDCAFIVRHAKLVVDTRNATRTVTEGREKIWTA